MKSWCLRSLFSSIYEIIYPFMQARFTVWDEKFIKKKFFNQEKTQPNINGPLIAHFQPINYSHFKRSLHPFAYSSALARILQLLQANTLYIPSLSWTNSPPNILSPPHPPPPIHGLASAPSIFMAHMRPAHVTVHQLPWIIHLLFFTHEHFFFLLPVNSEIRVTTEETINIILQIWKCLLKGMSDKHWTSVVQNYTLSRG